jgi:hypothetical protein
MEAKIGIGQKRQKKWGFQAFCVFCPMPIFASPLIPI